MYTPNNNCINNESYIKLLRSFISNCVSYFTGFLAMVCLLIWFVLSFTGFATSKSLPNTKYVISHEHKAKSFNFRQRFLVLHYTAGSFDRSLKILTEGPVSSHYLVPKGSVNGERKIFQLVDENLRAWTQGVSFWRGRNNLNDQGIGVEIVNLGYRKINGSLKYFPFPDYQIESVIELSKDIIKRYQITPYNVIGHSDCAPGRKVDPGPLFPWKKLFENGVGAWPNDSDVERFKDSIKQPISRAKFLTDLTKYGYKKVNPLNEQEVRDVVSSFQLHFRAKKFDGVIDVETYAILKALIKKYSL